MTIDRTVMVTVMRARETGFSLIELMVTLSVIAILTMVALPSFESAVLGNRLASYANNFVGSTQLARTEAIKRNATVIVCPSATGTACAGSGTWQQGWIVRAGTEVLQREQAISDAYSFTSTSGGYSLEFPAGGVGATPAVLKLCRASPAGEQERRIDITATGRATITRTTTGTCP